MTVRLRAHHLLCMLTYVGKGYDAAFTFNLDAIAKRLGDGEDILLIAGVDDICAPLLEDDAPHCLRDSVMKRDALAAPAIESILGQQIVAGARLRPNAALIGAMRDAFRKGETRSACAGCQWHTLCSDVAREDFRLARLNMRPAS